MPVTDMSWGQTFRLLRSRQTLVSAAFSVLAWALIWEWRSALVFVLLLYVHEAGHMLAALWRRVRLLSGPLFIPGLGAFVSFASGASAWSDVAVSLAGPLAGGLASAAVKVLALQQGARDVAFGAEVALIVNMVNLAPVAPFDGSRVFARLGKLALVPVFIASAAFVFSFTRQNLLVTALIGFAMFAMFRSRQALAPASWPSRAGILCVYIASVALLIRLHDATGGTARLLSGRELELLGSRTTVLGVPVGAAVMAAAALVLASFLVLPFAWRPNRTGTTRYGLTALLGWPQYLLFGETWRLQASLLLGAQVSGLPGMQWAREWIEKRARRKDPMTGVLAFWAVDCLVRNGRVGDASAWFVSIRPALSQVGIEAIERFALGLKLFGDAEVGHRLAVDAYLAREPDPSPPMGIAPMWANNAAHRLLRAGRPDLALPLAESAHRTDPKHPTFADTYGVALLASGRPVEAEEKLRLGLAEEHQHVHAMNLARPYHPDEPVASGRAALGWALAEQGRPTEGLAELDRALEAPDEAWLPDDVPTRETAERWREAARRALDESALIPPAPPDAVAVPAS